MLKLYGNLLLNTILPPRCPVSGDIVSEQGLISASVWAGLDFISKPSCVRCGYPFEVLQQGNDDDSHNQLCNECLDHEPEFETARSAIIYNDMARKLITGFKHADHLHILPSFLPWLITAGTDIWPKADMFIPVPLHPWRLIKRRYNQAAIIADALAKHMNRPCYKAVLKRVRYTRSQGHMSRSEREENMKNAFAVPDKKCALIDGKSVVLVDDVHTTGATVRSCAKILLESGASSVHIITIARALMPGYN